MRFKEAVALRCLNIGSIDCLQQTVFHHSKFGSHPFLPLFHSLNSDLLQAFGGIFFAGVPTHSSIDSEAHHSFETNFLQVLSFLPVIGANYCGVRFPSHLLHLQNSPASAGCYFRF